MSRGSPRGLRPYGIPAKLLARVNNGEFKTTQEWAKEFKIGVNYMSKVLSILRRNNHMLYPIGGDGKGGVIKNVVNSLRDYRESSNRLTNNFTNPHIVGTFRLLENYLIEDPKSHAEIEQRAVDLLLEVTRRKKELLIAPTKRHEPTGDSN